MKQLLGRSVKLKITGPASCGKSTLIELIVKAIDGHFVITDMGHHSLILKRIDQLIPTLEDMKRENPS